MKALVLSSSPRKDGNSAALAEAARQGLTATGHDAVAVHVVDILASFLGDCRQCRREDGSCAIDDGFRETFLDQLLPADGLLLATPVYWYGMSAQLKAFFDRMFCYVAASHPQSAAVAKGLQNKRIGLLVSSEETYPTVAAGVVHQVQEYCRYTGSCFVGLVHGYGNARGDVARDPGAPLAAARRFGERFFTAHASDYRIDSPRSPRMWRAAGA